MRPPQAILSWSSGKDCAFALHEVRRLGLAEVTGLLTTTNEAAGRVAMHGTRLSLLRAQAAALGLPLTEVPLPWPCSNAEYEARMAAATRAIRERGIRHMVFGDLFLADIRRYREERLAALGITALFPLWGRDTRVLAGEMLAAGLTAHLVTVDPARLPAAFAGRRFDADLLADLPPGTDPCGENGEFHTAVSFAPGFAAPIPVTVGETVTRDGFVYADLVPA